MIIKKIIEKKQNLVIEKWKLIIKLKQELLIKKK